MKGGIDTSLLDPFTFQNAEVDNDNDPWYIAVKPQASIHCNLCNTHNILENC